jgi:hypothetical protein
VPAAFMASARENRVGLGESHGVGHSVLEVEGIENVKSENTCFNSMA